MTSRNRPGVTTVVARPGHRRFVIIITALFGVCALAPLAGKHLLTKQSPKWAPQLIPHVPRAVGTADLAIVAVALIWSCFRSWRMGLYMDYQGVTVRNYFWTYRFRWPEVAGIVDGSVLGGWYWALRVLVRGGQAVTASGTARYKARPQELTAIREAAESHGISADLRGTRGGAWRGPKWRSYLPWALIVILFAVFVTVFIWIVLIYGNHCPQTCS